MTQAIIQRKSKEYITKDNKSPFCLWLKSLKDAKTKAKITKAIAKMRNGNFGDKKTIQNGHGLYERRIDYGPGYRIYYIIEGKKLIIIFGGSDKSEQQKTIDKCKDYLNDYKSRKKEQIRSSSK